MGIFTSLGFLSPWLLTALAVLPVLWWLLRAVPPAPVRRVFPAITLLLGLKDEHPQAQRSPWWLILLRLLAIAALIIGFAGPVLNPQDDLPQDGPLVVFIDSFWPAAPDWAARLDAVDQALLSAQQQGRLATVVLSHTPEIKPVSAAGLWREKLSTLDPASWDAPYDTASFMSLPKGAVLWISDGVARQGRAEILQNLTGKGAVSVLQPMRPSFGLTPAQLSQGDITVSVLRTPSDLAEEVVVQGMGRDPAGQLRPLTSATATFAAGENAAEVTLTLPPELRHRITWFQLPDARSAGGMTLVGEALMRRRVALIGAQTNETLALLSPDHFLRAALEPTTDIIEALQIDDVLRASPHVIILPDVPEVAEPDQRALAKWVADGGLLLRFAGPRLAAAQVSRGGDTGFSTEDVLLPVRLRDGGRVVGGAMSWGTPQPLAEFAPNSPFYGLSIPQDVTVAQQVLAQPDPELASRTLAELADGTPLVTRKLLGNGQVVLVHVGANAEWSSLVLSGLFVEMLDRLMTSSAGGIDRSFSGENTADPTDPSRASDPTPIWKVIQKISADGRLIPQNPARVVDAKALETALKSRGHAGAPPGIYQGGTRQVVVNALGQGDRLQLANWPANVTPTWGDDTASIDLSGVVLSLGGMLLLLDVFATLWITGRLRTTARASTMSSIAAMVLAVAISTPHAGAAQATNSPADVVAAAAEVTLAHVLTGDAQLDALARAGLSGLSDALFARTSVEPALPVGVDLERDALSVYPILYWPVSSAQAMPSPAAYDRLARYLATGGLILFDTRDAGVGGNGPEARKLRALAAPLGLPALDPVPNDHVVTRAFYLLDAFPGRHSGPVWAEASPPDARAEEGVPFRVLNDGVTPVIIGGNDWAGAWAVRPDGAPLLPVGRGRAGDRQREMALRFGINLVMHVLTGNYKSDQVHIPALLQRLGQ